jgi:Na+/H+ antiporter NhaC
MSESKNEIKEYAGGWITERKNTEAPGFLKIAFPIIGLGCTAYFVMYMNGEVSHEDRGALVQKFNQATTQADGLMYLVTALALIFVISVVLFTVRKSKHEE